jgi:hypothetical protein
VEAGALSRPRLSCIGLAGAAAREPAWSLKHRRSNSDPPADRNLTRPPWAGDAGGAPGSARLCSAGCVSAAYLPVSCLTPFKNGRVSVSDILDRSSIFYLLFLLQKVMRYWDTWILNQIKGLSRDTGWIPLGSRRATRTKRPPPRPRRCRLDRAWRRDVLRHPARSPASQPA